MASRKKKITGDQERNIEKYQGAPGLCEGELDLPGWRKDEVEYIRRRAAGRKGWQPGRNPNYKENYWHGFIAICRTTHTKGLQSRETTQLTRT
jgi:hypothetical protein